MAFIDKTAHFKGPNTSELFADGTYNLTQAVGSFEIGTGAPAPNRIPDMQLVYYFLFIIYRDGDRTRFPILPGEQFNIPPTMKNFSSPATKKKLAKRIWRFQTDLLKSGFLIYRDGRCDRARSALSSISKTRYTIHYCNIAYATTIKQKYNRDDWQQFLMSDTHLPIEVKAELQMSTVLT